MKRKDVLVLIMGLALGLQLANLIGFATAQEKGGGTPITETVAAEKARLVTEWSTKTAAEVKTEVDKLRGSAETKAAGGQVYVEKWSAEERVRQVALVKAVLGVSDAAAEAMIDLPAITFDGDGNPTFVTVEVKQ